MFVIANYLGGPAEIETSFETTASRYSRFYSVLTMSSSEALKDYRLINIRSKLYVSP